jgi:hypothetical protein
VPTGGDPTTPAAAIGLLTRVALGLLGWLVLAFLVYGLVIPITSGALTVAVTDRALGGQGTWLDYWGLLFKRLGRLLSALVPAAVLIAIGCFFLIIPGLVLCFFFALVPVVVIVENRGGVAALKRSYELVRSDWLRVALVFISFGVLNMVAHGLGGLFVPQSAFFLGHFLGDLLTLVLLPVPVMASVLLYLDLRRKRENYDQAALRRELEGLRGPS